jgi:alpha-tubulin suppressor-like RCC1 family protein
MEVTGRQGRRCKQLQYDVKETRGCWKVNEEALGRTVWRTGYGKGYGFVVRQTAEWMNWVWNKTGRLRDSSRSFSAISYARVV